MGAEKRLLTAAQNALAFYDGLERDHDHGEAAMLDALNTAVRAALSASPGVSVSAASSIPTASEDRRVEEMRERAAKVADDRSLCRAAMYEVDGAAINAYKSVEAEEIAWAIRALPLSPEDQEKAAATPTIADPDGEARS